jgi:hypothetical protein
MRNQSSKKTLMVKKTQRAMRNQTAMKSLKVKSPRRMMTRRAAVRPYLIKMARMVRTRMMQRYRTALPPAMRRVKKVLRVVLKSQSLSMVLPPLIQTRKNPRATARTSVTWKMRLTASPRNRRRTMTSRNFSRTCPKRIRNTPLAVI